MALLDEYANMSMSPANTLLNDLRKSLVAAMRVQHKPQVALLRSLIAAIDNAQATDVGDSHDRYRVHAFGSGTNEVPRRMLTKSDLRVLIETEISERRCAALAMQGQAEKDRVAGLFAEIAMLEQYLD